MQIQKARSPVSPPNNPFVLHKDATCFINNLPPELLSRTFEVGAVAGGSDNGNDTTSYTKLAHQQPVWKHGDNKDAVDRSVEALTERHDGENEDAKSRGESADTKNPDVTGSYNDPSPRLPFQVLVSHVCHHWRNVALSTPSLWTTIVAHHDDDSPCDRVSTMLERSKSLPIDIHLYWDLRDDTSELQSANFTSLCSLLVTHVDRWRTVKISVFKYLYMYIFLTAVSDPSISTAPQLETLELRHRGPPDPSSLQNSRMLKHFVLFGGSAPRLTRVLLWGVHVDWNQSWIASAPNLMVLELAHHPREVGPSWTQLSSILRGAPALERLALCDSGPSGRSPQWTIESASQSLDDPNAPIPLVKVTKFTFQRYLPEGAIGLLRKLYLPSLKNLVLRFGTEGYYTEFVSVLAGPAASLSQQEQSRSLLSGLERLKIAGLLCHSSCSHTLYSELENLTQLNIALCRTPRAFLETLCEPRIVAGQHGIWLPRLTTLYASGAFSYQLRSVVKRRMEMGAPLEALYMEKSFVYSEDVEWFKENLNVFGEFEDSDQEEEDDEDDEYEEEDEMEDDYDYDYDYDTYDEESGMDDMDYDDYEHAIDDLMDVA